MRFEDVILAYFIIGAVMWGGGAINWQHSGVGGLFIKHPQDNLTVNSQTAQNVKHAGGAISAITNTLGGGLIVAWNILVKLIAFLFWPIVTLKSVNAPPRIVVLGGGSLTVAFFGSLIRVIR